MTKARTFIVLRADFEEVWRTRNGDKNKTLSNLNINHQIAGGLAAFAGVAGLRNDNTVGVREICGQPDLDSLTRFSATGTFAD